VKSKMETEKWKMKYGNLKKILITNKRKIKKIDKGFIYRERIDEYKL
jgi:hypothetical protein